MSGIKVKRTKPLKLLTVEDIACILAIKYYEDTIIR